jgi:hypothetical protein
MSGRCNNVFFPSHGGTSGTKKNWDGGEKEIEGVRISGECVSVAIQNHSPWISIDRIETSGTRRGRLQLK